MKVCLHTYPFDNGHFEVKDLEEGCDKPDVDDGDECKDQSPQESGWDGHQGRDDAVQPQLGLTEQHVGQPPDGLESLGAGRLSQNVVEVNLQA